ncbi:MAG: alpha/beta hydrolase [Gammaproteobacteria bacterium]|nr:alpha/beta hydrolase [Gammaproteobacteria bacterium]
MANVDTEKLMLDGPEGQLEALLDIPSDADSPSAVAVVCHPHPLHDGTMHNKVAHMLARSFVQLGAPTLRFNFRGVGKSEGEFADAVGEVGDALAALDYMHQRWPDADRWLGGFSFGSQVSLSAALERDIDWLVTVAPPIERIDTTTFQRPDCDWLVVQGEADELFDASDVRSWLEGLERPPAMEFFPDTSHFFHGKLTKLRDAVVSHKPTDS